MMEGSKKQYADDISQFSSAGMIIRQKEPKNLEAPFDQIDSYLTPNELFYIRSHFPIPNLDRASYRLRIDGAVRRPLALSYEELRSMRSETRVATLECAGNSRVFLVPQVQGAQWELGAVSNAEWTGVPLRALLEPCRTAGRCLRDRARRSGSRNTQGRTHSSHPDLICLESAPSQGNSAGSPDRLPDEWS